MPPTLFHIPYTSFSCFVSIATIYALKLHRLRRYYIPYTFLNRIATSDTIYVFTLHRLHRHHIPYTFLQTTINYVRSFKYQGGSTQ